MSTNLQVGQIAECRIWALFGAQASVNSFHYHVDSVGASPSTDKDLSDAFDLAVSGVFKSLIANGVTYRGIQVQLIFPKPASVDVTTTVSTGVGTAGVGELPPQTAGLISFYSSLAGRAGRGRMYVPFPSVADNNAAGGGIPAAGYVTKLQSLAGSMTGLVTLSTGGRTAGISPCLMSKRPANYGAFVRIVNTLARPFWATQRRRSDFGRPNNSPI